MTKLVKKVVANATTAVKLLPLVRLGLYSGNKIWIVFHQESTIEISLRTIHPAIRPKNSDYIRDNSKICAKKTRDLAKNTRDPIFLAQTFPAIFPARRRPAEKFRLPGRPGSKIWIAGKFLYALSAPRRHDSNITYS